MSSSSSSSSSSETTSRFIGRVKWFNNKAGYGFITVTDGSKAGSDIFVHHSAIKVDTEQYKYLVQGEYVEFSMMVTTSDKHEFQAGDICGVKGGKLMCETRREFRSLRTTEATSEPIKRYRRVRSTEDNTRRFRRDNEPAK